MRIYLDHNASAPLAPEALEATTLALTACAANASSIHLDGQRAKAALDEARTAVAHLIGADPREVVFTSGGTESDNFAIRGAAQALAASGRRHLIASTIEHEAVLTTIRALGRQGWDVSWLPVGPDGIVDPASLAGMLRPDTALVSVMLANNEVGTLQPVAELAAAARAAGAWFHTDAVQAVGKVPVDVGALGVDLLALSAHKFGGPKGAGALWVRRGVKPLPLLTGGRQERNRRAGTENVPAIAGLGAAARRAARPLQADAAHVAALRDRLEQGLLDLRRLRGRGGRGLADRPGPRRHRRVHWRCVLVRHAGAQPRAARHGPQRRPRAERHPLQPRAVEHRGRNRPRARGRAPGGGPTEEGESPVSLRPGRVVPES
mgnify:CR=1 FL=1